MTTVSEAQRPAVVSHGLGSFPDTASGAFALLPSNFMVSGDQTRDDFLTSPEGRGASVLVSNGPYVSYQPPKRYAFLGFDWLLSFYFKDQDLLAVEMTMVLPDDPTDWASWNPSQEHRKKSLQDQLLVNIYGTATPKYPWGVVRSISDPRSGSTFIAIVYRDT